MNGQRLLACVILSSLLLITACGDGGGSTGTLPTKSVVKLLTAGTLPAGTLIGGIDITVSLPSGVTVASTANPPETDAGVAVASGEATSNSTILATYVPPSGTTPAKARLLIANTSGFVVGEFVTVNGDITAGNTPQAADFFVTSFTVSDLNGSPISGLTVGCTVNNQ